MSITTTISQPTKATLVLVPEHGPQVNATAEHLHQMGYVHALNVYMGALEALTRLMGLAPSVTGGSLTEQDGGHSAANLVRYFIECAIVYHPIGGRSYPADSHEMADRIVRHFAEAGGNEGNGPALAAALTGRCKSSDGKYRAGQRLKVNGMACTMLRVNPKIPTQANVEFDDGSWGVVELENDSIEVMPDPWAETDG